LIIACIMLVGFVAVGAVVAYKWQPNMHKGGAATITVWDGAREVPASIEFQA